MADENAQQKTLRLIDTLSVQVGTLAETVRNGFAEMHCGFAEMRSGFARVDRRLGRLETRVEDLETGQRDFRAEFERRVTPLERP